MKASARDLEVLSTVRPGPCARILRQVIFVPKPAASKQDSKRWPDAESRWGIGSGQADSNITDVVGDAVGRIELMGVGKAAQGKQVRAENGGKIGAGAVFFF